MSCKVKVEVLVERRDAFKLLAYHQQGGMLGRLIAQVAPVHDSKCWSITKHGACNCGADALYSNWKKKAVQKRKTELADKRHREKAESYCL